MEIVKKNFPEKWQAMEKRIGFQTQEAELWKKIVDGIYIPYNEELGIYEQDESYLSHEYMAPKDVPEEQIPLYRNWPMERIMRFSLLKQPDVLLLMHLLPERFDESMLRRNYDFYTPRTLHDSSLSPCIHSILASQLGYHADAMDFYERTARMDLDDVNKNTFEGLHLACMGGTWMTLVYGFAGMRTSGETLSFAPTIPKTWTGYYFKVYYQGRILEVTVTRKDVCVKLLNGEPLSVSVSDELYDLSSLNNVWVKDPSGKYEQVVNFADI
jgi:trehalose/maltose hydrolase-like predicted phosphorylase